MAAVLANTPSPTPPVRTWTLRPAYWERRPSLGPSLSLAPVATSSPQPAPRRQPSRQQGSQWPPYEQAEERAALKEFLATVPRIRPRSPNGVHMHRPVADIIITRPDGSRRRTTRRELARLIDTALPSRQAEALRLNVEEGRYSRFVAARLGISPTTVRIDVAHALQLLLTLAGTEPGASARRPRGGASTDRASRVGRVSPRPL